MTEYTDGDSDSEATVPELDRFTSHVDHDELTYWANDGTVLGLIREGSLLENDHDIDIGIWKEDEPALLSLFDELEETYEISSSSIKRHTKAYTLEPYDDGRSVNIKLFWEGDRYAYGVQAEAGEDGVEWIQNRYQPPDPRYVVDGVRLKLAWKYRYYHTQKGESITPFGKLYRMKTWLIPKRYFTDFRYLEEFGVNVPGHTKDYLKFRYGDWEEPDDDWCTYRDDGGIVDIDPLDVPVFPWSE